MSEHANSNSGPRESVQVTRSFMPELDDYVALLKGIWDHGQLTNNGPLVRELEEKLCEYLDVDHLFAVCNGTVALQIAIEALDLRDEVITTPFSYVATTSSLLWQHCRPVFADIDPRTLTIDPSAIEAAITPKTTGILATHVYGFPCDVDAIAVIAEKHGLRVIYDAAHCFGVRRGGRGLMRHGDIAISSFHATKVFHTAEGGALTTSDPELARRIAFMRNFGHKGREDFQGIGINGKMSELHAAMGLVVLPRVDEIISGRRIAVASYRAALEGVDGIRLLSPGSDVEWNSAYFPVILPSESALLRIKDRLAQVEIFPRRYFYPPLHHLPGLPDSPVLPITEDISPRVLCLPVYPGLEGEIVDRIASEIRSDRECSAN